jgi:hypothetical protein
MLGIPRIFQEGLLVPADDMHWVEISSAGRGNPERAPVLNSWSWEIHHTPVARFTLPQLDG